MSDKVVSIALAAILAFCAAADVFALVKLTGATDKINNMFCIEGK